MDLKKCPCCGDFAEAHAYNDGLQFYIECQNCRLMTDYYDTLDRAENAWNLRSGE